MARLGAVDDDQGGGLLEVRASDEDREGALGRLRERVADGSLTLDEFADRAGVALVARTRGQLQAIVADLAAGPVGATRRRQPRRWLVAVMSGSKAKGRWRAAGSVRAVAFWGSCQLDFRRAEIEAPEVRVTAVALMGGIDVIVPEGIDVELTGLAVMGGKHLRVADVPALPGSPVIRVRAFALMGGVGVRSRGEPGTRRARGVGRGPQGSTPSAPTSEPAPLAPPVGLDEVEDALPRAGGDVEGTVTIMFSDIAGYSAITERLGDLAAHELLRTHNAIVREAIAGHDGREVKAQGDGFMVAFPSATRALRGAVAIQQAFEKYCTEHPEEPVRVHVGLDTGEPVHDGGDLLGRTVIVASRLTAEAGPGEILVSSLLHDLAEPAGEFRFGAPRQVELKGLSGTRAAYPVDWR